MTPEQLKSLRKSHGLSVTQAARLAEVSDRFWQRCEAGKKAIPEGMLRLFQERLTETAGQGKQ